MTHSKTQSTITDVKPPKCTFTTSLYLQLVGYASSLVRCFPSRMQMFLWNNIFFSLGFDVKDHYKDFGGDFAAYVAPVSCPLVVTSQLA